MNKYTIVLLCFNALFILVPADNSTCPQVSTFPSWMIGSFMVQFGDGSIGNKTVGLWYANITLPNGTHGRLTMTAPLNKSDHFFINHDCLQMQDAQPLQRCSLIVPQPDFRWVFRTLDLGFRCPSEVHIDCSEWHFPMGRVLADGHFRWVTW